MDLRSYIESEQDEEKALGYGGASGAAGGGSANGYPGDPAAHVAEGQVTAERMTLTGGPTELGVYIARPSTSSAPAPAVIVIHENKGLVPYIEDVARRLAVRGYVAVAPDLLSRAGGTGSFEGPEDVTKTLGEISGDDIVADVRTVLSQVAEHDYVDADRLGIVGFCYGGGVAWRVLTQEPRLRVGVPFYGPIPSVDAVPGIQAPVMGIYGELDARITSMLPDITAAMKQNGKTFEAVVLPDAQHAFHNDTNPDRYNAEAASEAWEQATSWLDRWLKHG